MQATKQKPTAAEVTPDVIAAWKHQYGEIFKITCEDKVIYLRKPDRKILSFATAGGGTADPFKFNEMILKNCMLGGDEDIITNDDYFLAVSGKLDEVVKFKEAELEKL